MSADDAKVIGEGAQHRPEGVRREAGSTSERPATPRVAQSGLREGGLRAEVTSEEALKATLSRGGDWDKMVSDGKVPQSPVASDARHRMSGIDGQPAEPVVKGARSSEQTSKAVGDMGPPEIAPSRDAQNRTVSTIPQGSAAVSAAPGFTAPGLVYSPLAMSAELGETLEGTIAFDRTEPAAVGDARRDVTANAGSATAHLARTATRQIADSIRFPMDGSIEIKLSPEELGRVKLSMLPGDAGTMTVQLTVERADTLELLRRHADLLATDLRDAGYSGIEFSFSREGDRNPSSDRSGEACIADDEKATDGASVSNVAKRGDAPLSTGVDLRLEKEARMDLLNPNSPQSASAASATAAKTGGTGVLSSDFETFLKMLTTQMKNQDPLNPIESQDFAVQLATFSGVEQQVRTNDLLESLAGGLGLSGISQLAGWVGMEARVDASADYNGAPITLFPNPDPASDAAMLIVHDEFGRVVSREAVPVDAISVDWVGLDGSGAPLLPGKYTFELESLNAGQVTSTKPVEHYALITEARQGPSGIEIVLQGGESVLADHVSALRNPTNAP